MKNILLVIIIYSNLFALEFENFSCDEGFTFYSDLPQTVTIINGDNCLSDSDMSVLEDIISLNNLDDLESINLGTQNWANGRLVWLKIGDSFDGGNVNLTELPPSIGNLSNLGMLFLDYNSLTSLPESIGNLSNLIYLVLSFNDIVALPESIGNLSYLLWIDLGYNQVSYIPESIENLSNLQYLWLFNNQLESLPGSICNLDLDWSGFDPADLPYFGCGGNVLCDVNAIPECVLNSDNFEISLEANYYSFPIYVPQDCSDDCPSELGDTNGDGIINILDIVLTVNTVVFGDSSAIECSADINGDGIINILDIVQLVNIIVG